MKKIVMTMLAAVLCMGAGAQTVKSIAKDVAQAAGHAAVSSMKRKAEATVAKETAKNAVKIARASVTSTGPAA